MSTIYAKFLAISVLISAIAVSCGGQNEQPTGTRLAGSVTQEPVSTSAPVPTVSTTALATTTIPGSGHIIAKDAGVPATGTPLDNAILVSNWELDGLRYGGTIREGTGNTTATIDPTRNNSSPINSVGRYIYEKLIGMKPRLDGPVGEISPVLAESWKASADLTTYTFKLRQGIKWQNLPPVNGRELVADDVVFSIERNMKPDSIRYVDYQQIDSVTAPDKYTIVMKLKTPNAWALNDMFTRPDYVVARELVAQESDGILKLKAIGTGPFIIKSYEFRRSGTFIRNPAYWDKDIKGNPLPYVDTVEQTYLTDTATTVAGYRTGQFDFMYTGSTLGTLDIINMAKTIPGLRTYSPSVGATSGMAFNTKAKPWSDVNVRRAVNMALDKNKFAELTSATPAWQYGLPMRWDLVSDKPFKVDDLGPYYKYNSQEAKKLLIQAGFPDGKLKISAPIQIGGAGSIANYQVIQDLWKKEGIELEISAVESVIMFTSYYTKQHKDLAPTFQTFGDLSLNTYAQNKFAINASENTSFIDDPEVQKVVASIKTTTDPAKLREYARFLWDFDTLGVWNIWMPGGRTYIAVTPHVRNYMPRYNDNFTSARNGIEWWLTDAPRTSP